MNQKQFENLKRGDLVRHKMSGSAYVVEHTSPHIAVRTVQVSNPHEWNLVDQDGRIRYAPEERRYTKAEIAAACSVSTIISTTTLLDRLEKVYG